MKLCKICGRETKAVFNIELKEIPICEQCADAITVQQVLALVRENEASGFTENLARKSY